MTRRILFFALLLSMAPLARISSVAAVPQDPALFIRSLGSRALAVLKPSIDLSVRRSRFQKLYEQYFDTGTIARFVLGRYWRIATPAEKRQFMILFEKYVIFAYSARLSAYSGEIFRVTGSRPDGSGFIVRSEIYHPQGQAPTTVYWRLNQRGDGLKIVDVIVEGISMSITQRSEFASVIARNGGSIGALLALMRQKIEQAAG